MSVNVIYNQTKKQWLDTNVGNIDVTGTFTYKNSDRVLDDVLQLDNNFIAQWTPAASLLLGISFEAHMVNVAFNSTNATSEYVTYFGNPSVVYTYDGNSDGNVTINEAGTYLISGCLLSEVKNNVVRLLVRKNNAVSPQSDISGLPQQSPNFIKNVVYTYDIQTCAPGDTLGLTFSSSSGIQTNVIGIGSFISIVKLY